MYNVITKNYYWNIFYILQYNFKTDIIMRTTKNSLRMREMGFKNGLEVLANGNNIHSDSDICQVLFTDFPDVANKITEYLDEISE